MLDKQTVNDMGIFGSFPEFDNKKTVLNCKDMGISQVPYNFVEGHPLVLLDLSNNRIRDLPKNLVNLKELILTRNHIEKISKSMYIALKSYSNLQIIRLNSNMLSSVPDGFFQEVKGSRLYLNRNQFSSFPFSECQFETLDLSCNQIEVLTDLSSMTERIFLGFNIIKSLDISSTRLQELVLSGNCIETINSNLVFPALVTLDLSMNRIRSLDNFRRMFPSVQICNISFNLLATFPELPLNVITVFMNDNLIEVAPNSLKELNRLRNLHMYNNLLQILPELPTSIELFRADHCQVSSGANIVSKQLLSYNVSNNNMSELPDYSQSSIKVLIMSSNKFSDLNISRLPCNLVVLNLSRNGLTSLPDALFSIPTLQRIDVNDNQITSLPHFIATAETLVLNISSNPINDIYTLPLGLQHLIAYNCKFTEFPGVIVGLSFLTLLDLSFNQMDNIPDLDSITKVFLSHNKISVFPVIDPDISILDLSFNNLSTFHLQGYYPSLTEFDVSHNNITEFLFDSPKYNIKYLKLSHNPLKFVFPFEIFPLLDTLDIASTEISFVLPQNRPREIIITDNDLNNAFFSVSVNCMGLKGVGYSEMKGCRETMEDSMFIHQDFPGGFDAYAVFDGHGGSNTSCSVSHMLHQILEYVRNINNDSLISVCRNVNDSLKEKGFADGCTMSMIIHQSNYIHSVNIGDSRSLLIKRDGKATALTVDHKPTSRSEIERIRMDGSFVSEQRTSGILALSRSFGDFMIEGVTWMPDINKIPLTPEDYRIVIACDGVFDELTNEEVGMLSIIDSDPMVSAARIRNAAFSRNSMDNISCIVVDLHK